MKVEWREKRHKRERSSYREKGKDEKIDGRSEKEIGSGRRTENERKKKVKEIDR